MFQADLVKDILPAKLMQLAREKAALFQQATPFPYIVIDDFLDPEDAELLAATIPPTDVPEWQHMYTPEVRNAFTIDGEQLDSEKRQLYQQFNSVKMLRFIEELTGCSGILPDPYLIAIVGQLRAGGFEGLHADTNYHGILNLYRRFGCIYYLCKDWKEEYGGAIEIWDKQISRCIKRIIPAFNRFVIYNFGSSDFHALNPIAGEPAGLLCNYLTMVYCTNEPQPGEEPYFHNYLWQKAQLSDSMNSGREASDVPVNAAQTELERKLAKIGRHNNYLLEQMGQFMGKRDMMMEHERNLLIHRIATLEQRSADLSLNISRLEAENQRVQAELERVQQYNHGLLVQHRSTFSRLRDAFRRKGK